MTGPGRLATAGAVAAVFSGVPSTVWALVRGHDPLEASRAAGTLLPGRLGRPGVVRGLVAHLAVSTFWAGVLGLADRRRPLGPAEAVVAGLGIAAVDLGLVGRRLPAIRRLPQPAQWADHLAFAGLFVWALRRGARGAGAQLPDRWSRCPNSSRSRS